jgi:predicted RNase H-like nuclease (RuvC/YqgF family)
LNQGRRLIYECRRCKFKNLIFTEKPPDIKDQKQKLNPLNNVKKTFIEDSKILLPSTVMSMKSKRYSVNKKMQSLRMKLKESELKQQQIKQNQQNNVTSLSDFLLKLT